MEEMAKHL